MYARLRIDHKDTYNESQGVVTITVKFFSSVCFFMPSYAVMGGNKMRVCFCFCSVSFFFLRLCR